jgi:rRNA processing protein Gar1
MDRKPTQSSHKSHGFDDLDEGSSSVRSSSPKRFPSYGHTKKLKYDKKKSGMKLSRDSSLKKYPPVYNKMGLSSTFGEAADRSGEAADRSGEAADFDDIPPLRNPVLYRGKTQSGMIRDILIDEWTMFESYIKMVMPSLRIIKIAPTSKNILISGPVMNRPPNLGMRRKEGHVHLSIHPGGSKNSTGAAHFKYASMTGIVHSVRIDSYMIPKDGKFMDYHNKKGDIIRIPKGEVHDVVLFMDTLLKHINTFLLTITSEREVLGGKRKTKRTSRKKRKTKRTSRKKRKTKRNYD